ncbi:MAG: hypothetical protein GY943_10190 [Chloroflexi bacterium]|nr:hypothetical protein [Chloroflexota bacterium]
MFLWWRSDRKKLWPGLAWFGVGTAVFLIPWALLFLQQPELILGRSGQVSIFNPIINGGDLWGTLWRQIGRGVGMFFWRGDDILRHNPAARPVFDWATAVPFLMGVSWCIKQWRKPAAMLLLLWSTVMLGPTILAEDAPHFLRAVGLLPAILIFPAIGFNQLWQWQRLPRWGRQTAVLLLLVISFGLTLRDYQAYSQDPEAAFLFEMAALTLGEQIRDEAVDTAVYMDRWFWDDVRQQGWSAVPFIADLEDVVVYRPEFGLSLPQSGQAVSVYAWQFGSLAFVPQLINAPAHVTITSGQLARGDLEPSSYPLYVRYHAQPVIHSQDVVANFENQFLLRQLTAELLPHNQLRITMEWEQGTAVSQNLNSFIHIIDVDGIMAQDDAPPGGTLWQPNWWQPGIIVEDQRIIQLAEPFDPEMHQIQVGLYQPETNVRLIATDTSGQALGDAVSTFLLHD